MRLLKALLPILLVALVAGCGSSTNTASPANPGSKSPGTIPASPPSPGKITAKAAGISGQNGKLYSVVAYDYDWQPGATGAAVGGIRGIVPSDDFSLTATLQNEPGPEDKMFDAKTYSVVFFISSPGSPPQYFTEVRVTVNGDVNATAPKWTEWVHL